MLRRRLRSRLGIGLQGMNWFKTALREMLVRHGLLGTYTDEVVLKTSAPLLTMTHITGGNENSAV